MKGRVIAAALTVGWTVGAPLGSRQETGLELHTARFYRGASAQTLVDVFCRVPFALLDPLAPGTGGQAAYRISVSVRDSVGLELLVQSWTDGAPAAMLQVPRAAAVQHFTFAVRPGQYTVDVALKDSATGRVSRQRLDVAAFAGGLGGSDLLLATGIRRAGGQADTVARPGEVRKGSIFLQASGRPVLTPQQASLGYYLELYPQQPETAVVVVRVLRPDGSPVVTADPQRIPLDAGGGATRGLVPLAGLPPGGYRLEVAAALHDSQVVRSAEFRMAGFETEAAIATVARTSRAEMFEGLSEAQLDTLYAPLVYEMASDEQGIYPTLSVEGKRSFLRQFWAKRDPSPGTAGNEARERFYRGIAEANRRFREGGAAEVPGWRTDRGRIFIRYGPPDEVLQRPQPGNTMPYEVWKYSRTRGRKFVFMDLTAFGNYALIWTDERREPSRPNWRELLGPDAVLEVERY